MIKNFKLALATAALVIGGIAGFAAADKPAQKAPGGSVVMQKSDGDQERDDDGPADAASKRKHETMKKERLAKYDTNKDGKLDDGERAMMATDKITEQFKKLDTNGDGKLTLDEFKAGRMGRGGPGHHRGGGRRKP